MSLGRAREPAARNHDAIQRISASDKPCGWIDSGSKQGVVILFAEERLVTPQCVVRHHDAVAETIFEHQLRIDAPLVLAKAFDHVAAEERVGTRANLAVSIKQAQGGVGYGCFCGRSAASVIRE